MNKSVNTWWFVFLIVAFVMLAQCAHAANLTLTWTDNSSNEAGFIVERAPGANAAANLFVEIARTPENGATYTDQGLAENQQFSYRVRAFNNAGVSDPSNTAWGVTMISIPGKPGDLKVTSTGTAVTISIPIQAVPVNTAPSTTQQVASVTNSAPANPAARR